MLTNNAVNPLYLLNPDGSPPSGGSLSTNAESTISTTGSGYNNIAMNTQYATYHWYFGAI